MSGQQLDRFPGMAASRAHPLPTPGIAVIVALQPRRHLQQQNMIHRTTSSRRRALAQPCWLIRLSPSGTTHRSTRLSGAKDALKKEEWGGNHALLLVGLLRGLRKGVVAAMTHVCARPIYLDP